MSRIVIYPDSMSNESSSLLKAALIDRGHTAIRVYPDRKYRRKGGDLIINWGSTVEPSWSMRSMKNPCAQVEVAASPYSTYRHLRGEVHTYEYFSSVTKAQKAVDTGRTVMSCGPDKKTYRHNFWEEDLSGVIDIDGDYIEVLYGEKEYTAHVTDSGTVITCDEDVIGAPEVIYWTRAIRCLGLSFGQVNVTVRSGVHYITGVNPAPTLDMPLAAAYAKVIEEEFLPRSK